LGAGGREFESPHPDHIYQVVQRAWRNSRSQTGFGDDIYVVPEEFLEIHQEPSEIEESAIVVEVDEEVNVARLGGVATGD
jgi:hypothetical protein